ncbi:hypothetical protein HCH_02638 [Hahella chejuensis KCTC 2396]|uniref:Uncharacterized protein n=1 Tax=Hahella chejuensis (strain KCTC 2396) TaxID=349521 RepID=Q2SIU7_HAHCH|nr:type II toxin-antitoxin system YafO family toxin [Hahella chejuensis]ABC29427.1 hypothetical protein HCH_02638 [Hahella chejuensis KCTC 2396]
MTIKVFEVPKIREARKQNPYLSQLIKDFSAYKNGGFISYFGRDTLYLEPRSLMNDAKVLHIHLLHENHKWYKAQQEAIKSGREPIDNYMLRCDVNPPEFDRALIYTQGRKNKNYYLILDFLNGYAHARTTISGKNRLNNTIYMEELVKKAEDFRNAF